MKVTVLFFGVLTEVTGTGTRFYSDVRTLGDLKVKIADDYPDIVNYDFRISLNNEIISENPELRDGDEIALLPPFAGG
jgi:molybdopterin converting factor small subunit